MAKTVPLDRQIVFVQRITDPTDAPLLEASGYLVACYGPFASQDAAVAAIPAIKRTHPRFADDAHYYIGIRPLRRV